jgi:hypothetical protein
MFSSVSQFNSKRVCLVTRKFHETEACKILDNLIDTLITNMTAEEREKHTFPGRKPVRVGRRTLPSEIELYMNQLPLKCIDLTTNDDGKSVDNIEAAYSMPPSRYGKRSYMDATRGTQPTTQASMMSGSTTLAPSQGSSALDAQFKEAMAMLESNTKKMEAKQQEIQIYQEKTETRFTDIENKLGTVVEMFKKSNTNQLQMQDTLTEQQAQLSKICMLLVAQLTNEQEEDGRAIGSPTRKKRLTGNSLAVALEAAAISTSEDESMEATPGSQPS